MSSTYVGILRPRYERPRWPRIPYEFLGSLALGNSSAWPVWIISSKSGVLFALPSRNICMSTNTNVTPEEVVQKLDLELEDAENIADLINSQFDFETKEFGKYFSRFCLRPGESVFLDESPQLVKDVRKGEHKNGYKKEDHKKSKS